MEPKKFDKNITSFLSPNGDIWDFRDKVTKQINEGVISKTFMEHFSWYLKRNDLRSITGAEWERVNQRAFNEFAKTLRLSPAETKKCYNVYLND